MTTRSPARKIRNPKTRFNWRVSDFVRRFKSFWLETQARASGRGYYCSALTGESDYNLTINSDLTVSCNCQDYDGSGHLGDLHKNTFEEVFFGPVAQKFQDELVSGKIPIPTCTRCGDFKRLAAGHKSPPKAHLPNRGILLENTVRCNVDCIGCAREGAANLRVNRQVQMPLADFLPEPWRTVPVAERLPGAADFAREKPRQPHRGFDQRRFAEHGRQARGGAELEPHPFFRPRHQ
jgi:hypothetical protein